MLNHVCLMGRLTRDPELRRTSSGIAVVSFTLAVDRDYKGQGGDRETDFIDCIAWRSTAEYISKYFTKGRMMVVAGRLQKRSYQSKSGDTHYVTEVVADSAWFGDSKKETATEGSNFPGQNGATYSRPQVSQQFQQQTFGGYHGYSMQATPDTQRPGEAFSLLEDDDTQWPF